MTVNVNVNLNITRNMNLMYIQMQEHVRTVHVQYMNPHKHVTPCPLHPPSPII
jgi:hypothetical protein